MWGLAYKREFISKRGRTDGDHVEQAREDAAMINSIEYNVARLYMCLLACAILLWCCPRLSELRLLVVNWDIRRFKKGDGSWQIGVEPVHCKNQWAQSAVDQVADCAKWLPLKAQGIYDEYIE